MKTDEEFNPNDRPDYFDLAAQKEEFLREVAMKHREPVSPVWCQHCDLSEVKGLACPDYTNCREDSERMMLAKLRNGGR